MKILKLRIALKSYENGVAEMWDCTKADRNELKIAAFDYIRLGLEQTAIRDLFRKPSRTNSSIFGSKSIWESFKEKYNDALIEEKPVEQWIEEHPGEDIDKVLKARDDSWRRRSKEKLEGAFRDSQETLSSRLQAKEPERLVNKAFNAISSIDVGASSFKNNASSISSGLQELIELAQQLLNAANEIVTMDIRGFISDITTKYNINANSATSVMQKIPLKIFIAISLYLFRCQE